jgi:DNA-binding NtrC family response regulator
MAYNVLVIDDEENLCWLLKETFALKGYEASYCHTVEDGVRKIRKEHPDVVILDMNLPDGNGKDLLQKIKNEASETIVIMLTAQNSVKLAVDCLQLGAAHFLTKPFVNEDLLIKVEQAIKDKLMEGQLEALHSQILRDGSLGEIVGKSEPMQELYALIKQVASIDSNTTVLITGETGTGKETVAKAIHAQSFRKDKPFMAINCTALPDSLLESELFGHEKGAFTGAEKQRRGFFELARGGSLFLDEIAELSPGAQAKLLRVLQEKCIMRIGGTKEINVDIRIIAATNRDLKEMMEQGEFREDLYFRLNVFPIHVPPLRTRGKDINLLAEHFLKRTGNKLKLPGKHFSADSKTAIGAGLWPGNVRQLQNMIERALLITAGDEISPSDLGLNSSDLKLQPEDKQTLGLIPIVEELAHNLKPTMASLEKLYIQLLMKEHGESQKTVAKILNIDAKTLYRKLKKYNQ